MAGLIRAERPRLVLLDPMLPGADGIGLMTSIPELTDLPVVFISGCGRDEIIARAFEAGAADYIVKLFSATELVARVGAALRARGRGALCARRARHRLRQAPGDGNTGARSRSPRPSTRSWASSRSPQEG